MLQKGRFTSTIGNFTRQEPLANQAYNLLKKAIITGELKGGESLPEEKMAKELGISRTPLRDALNRLAAEGLIIHQTGSPALVADFTKEDSLNFIELRGVLEVHNIEKITSSVDAKFIQSLRKNLRNQLDAIEKNIYHDFIEFDREFHLLLASKNNNKVYKDVIHHMNTGVNRAFIILSRTVPSSAEEAYQEHIEIVDALEQQNVSLARNKMIVHLNNVEKRFLRFYDAQFY